MKRRAEDMFDFIKENPNCTELEIAHGVGLKKTPYTRFILMSLISFDYVARFWQEDRQPRPAYVYYVQLTQPLED